MMLNLYNVRHYLSHIIDNELSDPVCFMTETSNICVKHIRFLLLSCPETEVGLLHDRWRHKLSPLPQFRHGTGGEGNIFQYPTPVVSVATAHKSFGSTDLTSTYSVCTRRVFGGIRHRTQALLSEIRCFNHKATHGPQHSRCYTTNNTVSKKYGAYEIHP
ncbi:uncharacterized protein TNCV_585331 [Trichonephila clavipes]|nr:uncharacterized protein TNCV_585331 [Trichonephila clavipes]